MSKLKAFIPAMVSLALIAAHAIVPAHAAGNRSSRRRMICGTWRGQGG